MKIILCHFFPPLSGKQANIDFCASQDQTIQPVNHYFASRLKDLQEKMLCFKLNQSNFNSMTLMLLLSRSQVD